MLILCKKKNSCYQITIFSERFNALYSNTMTTHLTLLRFKFKNGQVLYFLK